MIHPTTIGLTSASNAASPDTAMEVAMPADSNNVNARDGASIEWGPEIRVDGKRPEWLGGDPKKVQGRSNHGDWLDVSMNAPLGAWAWEHVRSIRLPANHPHYSKAPTASAVDWSRSIEAVHEDGTVVPMIFERFDGSCAITTDDPRKDSNQYWEMDGTDCVSRSRWRIRNVQPTTPELDPALWDRMVALCEHAAASASGHTQSEATAILAAVKPTDPDLIEARRLACENSNWPRDSEHRLNVKQGKQDHIPMVRTALAAIKRGRELATPEVSHVG